MKVVAIASGGGHWVELLRLQYAFEGHELVYVSTNEAFKSTVPEFEFHTVPDFSQWDRWKIIIGTWKILRLFWKIRPTVVVTTGAAPGVIALFIGKLLGAKTIWVESLCHAAEISISGKMVGWFADRVYTQWEHLSNHRFVYAGNIMQ